MTELFISALVTFFVAIDPPGVAPIFFALTDGSPKAHRRAMAYKSVLIATGVLLAFALGGRYLLDAMHISLDAFRTAGGVLLFLMALEMIFEKRTERREERAEKLTEEQKLDQAVKFAGPIMNGLSKLSDKDSEIVLYGLLAAVEMKQAEHGNWARLVNGDVLAFDTIELPVLLQAAGRSFMYNMAGFFDVLQRNS